MKFSWQRLSQIFEEYLPSHEKIESEVDDLEELTPRLMASALYTSLEDLRRIQTHPLVTGTWIDLGAGIGQSIMTYLLFHPEREAYGVEKSRARLRAGYKLLQSLGLSETLLQEGDLLSDSLMEGDTYFLYFPTGKVLDRILAELLKRPTFRIVAIESHGDLLPRLKLEPGLKLIGEIPLSSPRHHPFALVFEKQNSGTEKLELFNRSFKKDFIFIEEEGRVWVAETYGAEWIGGEKFNLLNPPRTIHHSWVKDFLLVSELDSLTQFLCELRRRGEIEIIIGPLFLRGEIRKIFLKPSFCLELSGGQTVKWDDIHAIILKGHRCYDSSSPSSLSLPVA